MSVRSYFLKTAIILSFCLAAPLLYSAEKPYAHKDIELGSDISEIANDPRFLCRASNSPLADQSCHLLDEHIAEENIAGVPILSFTLNYLDDKLSTIVITFFEGHFKRVKKTLQQKYGTPSKRMVETYVNRTYELFEGDVYLWENNISSVDFIQHYSNIHSSAIVYKFSSYIDELNK